jgi:hypothetical protein
MRPDILSQWLITGWKIFPPHIYCAIAVFLFVFPVSIRGNQC